MQLEAKTISFRYSPNHPRIIDKFSLSLCQGDRIVFQGPSGSGKSTLGALLSGYINPTHGHILCDNKPLTHYRHSPVQLIHQQAEKSLNPNWNIKTSLQEAGVLESGLFDELKIKNSWLSKYPAQLSGGELQRINIIRALGDHTQFIIADEITSMLDTITQAQIWHALLKITESRKLGLFVITHNHYLADYISANKLTLP